MHLKNPTWNALVANKKNKKNTMFTSQEETCLGLSSSL